MIGQLQKLRGLFVKMSKISCSLRNWWRHTALALLYFHEKSHRFSTTEHRNLDKNNEKHIDADGQTTENPSIITKLSFTSCQDAISLRINANTWQPYM